jgi:hypothetical protein
VLRKTWSLGCALLFLATAARADPPPSDERTIQLRDGSMYRGELVELVPNDHMTIKLATGDIKRFAWADLKDAPVDAGPAEATAPKTPPGVHVTMFTDDSRAGLFRVIGYVPTTTWAATPQGGVPIATMAESTVFECKAPCDKDVDPQFTYRIAGDGITPSRMIQFGYDKPAYKLRVEAGSTGSRVTGIILSAVGLSFAGGGGTGLLVSALSPTGGSDTFTTVSAITAGTGAVLLAVGIGLWVSSKTTVRVDSAETAPALRLPAGLALGPKGIVF